MNAKKTDNSKKEPPYSLKKNLMNGDWLLVVDRPCVLKVVHHQTGFGHLSEQRISFRELSEDEVRKI